MKEIILITIFPIFAFYVPESEEWEARSLKEFGGDTLIVSRGRIAAMVAEKKVRVLSVIKVQVQCAKSIWETHFLIENSRRFVIPGTSKTIQLVENGLEWSKTRDLKQKPCGRKTVLYHLGNSATVIASASEIGSIHSSFQEDMSHFLSSRTEEKKRRG